MKKRILFLIKFCVSAAIMVWIAKMVFAKGQSEDLWQRMGSIRWAWVMLAVVAQLGAITCSLFRWHRLLIGQGIVAPFKHLITTFMIGRFFGAFTPGGWTGLNGYRIYDIAKYTGQTARAAATIGIEMLLGQLAFGVVVIVGSIFGAKYIGWQGVLLVDLFFAALIVAVIFALSRPNVFRKLAEFMPKAVQPKVRTTLDAVCAYQGQGKLLASAFFLGVGTHTFNNLVFVASAHALNADLKPWDVFFVSAMQIFATLIPASINGIGLREGTAVALYSRVGVPVSLATLIPLVGFAVEMFVSAWGGLMLALRPVGYRPEIKVSQSALETTEPIQTALREDLPNPLEATGIGFTAGALAGFWLGVIEATRLVLSSQQHDWSVLFYGGVFYSLVFGLAGAAMACVIALWRRQQQEPNPDALGRLATASASLFSMGFFAAAVFLVRRDVFHEALNFKSVKGLWVLTSAAVVCGVLFFIVRTVVRGLTRVSMTRWVSQPWAGLPLWVMQAAVAYGASQALLRADRSPEASNSPSASTLATKKPEQPPVILIVVDTLRADHLPAWGYTKGSTPSLDAFSKDSIRFEHAYANASWTRPSFATILSGRFPSSHRTMAKMDAFPDAVETLPEHLKAMGYATAGFVTNYNVAPFFNFQQGFTDYHYLEPEFILGANDTAAKLLWVQAVRNKIEAWRASTGRVRPGTAYQDAETVNKHVLRWLNQRPKTQTDPYFLFIGYMDPHDPYFEHPYSGEGYARAAHQKPDLREAAKLEALYDGEITYWDSHFGKLIASLKERGDYDKSLIIITADHGEEFGDHGGFWHGTTLYDEQVHVPLWVKLPQQQKGGSVESQWVQHVDIAPSVLSLLGRAMPTDMQGGNWSTGSLQVFAEESHEGNVLRSLRAKTVAGERKLIEANDGNPRGLQPRELYGTDVDPKEQTNLVDKEQSVVAQQSQALQQIHKSVERNAPLRQTVDVANDTRTVDKLKALGYGE